MNTIAGSSEDKFHEKKISAFRVFGVDKDYLCTCVKNILGDFSYKIVPYHKNNNLSNIIIPITGEPTGGKILSDTLIKLVADESKYIEYDFFFSVSSGSQSSIVDIPKRFLDLYRLVGGKVRFSYTCTYDLEND